MLHSIFTSLDVNTFPFRQMLMIYRKGSLVEGITSDPGTIGEVVEKCVRNDTCASRVSGLCEYISSESSDTYRERHVLDMLGL